MVLETLESKYVPFQTVSIFHKTRWFPKNLSWIGFRKKSVLMLGTRVPDFLSTVVTKILVQVKAEIVIIIVFARRAATVFEKGSI